MIRRKRGKEGDLPTMISCVLSWRGREAGEEGRRPSLDVGERPIAMCPRGQGDSLPVHGEEQEVGQASCLDGLIMAAL